MAEASRVLFCAFAEVPGTTSAGTRTAQWLSVFGSKEMDALALKGTQAAHIQRLGGARMMRVPNTSGKPLFDRLSTYTRALQRQLNGEPYDLVWCADLFSAAIVAPLVKGTAPMIVEVSYVPSQSRVLTNDDADVKRAWRDGERTAIRAAARVLVPSRHSAKLIGERIDPRVLAVVPRSVDRSVFSPPSVEIAIDDERLVVVFGGREGGGRTKTAVGITQALAITLPASVRIGILGAPSAADPDVRAALARVGLADRVELIDADSPLAVSAALALAHVVVVPSCAEEDTEPYALPHRALEAMACGRAVVVTGPEGCFKEGATSGEHLMVTPARDPRRVADAVEALLEDPLTRASLGRAAARHLERAGDLMTRAQDVHALIVEATKISLKLHPPRGDDPDTQSKSVEGAAMPEKATAFAAPPALPSSGNSSMSGPVFAATRKEREAAQSSPQSSPDVRPVADLPGVLSVVQPVPTVRMEMPHLGESSPSVPEAGAMWDGDTFLDGHLEGAPLAIDTSPDASRVRAAMLVSSDAQSRAESSIPTPRPSTSTASISQRSDEASQPSQRALRSSDEAQLSQPSNPAVPTSIIVQAALESKPHGGDPWASDTIADGTPIDSGRELAAPPEPAPRGETRRSFLVDAGVGGATVKAPPRGPRKAPPVVVDVARETTKVGVISDADLLAADDDAAPSDMTMEDQPLPGSDGSGDSSSSDEE